MCVGLIGGMDRLGKHYLKEAKKEGVELKLFNRWVVNLSKKIIYLDALILFTDKISHTAKKEAMDVARSNQIPVFMYHSSGISTFRRGLNIIKNLKRGE